MNEMITRDMVILDMYLSVCNVYVPGREEGIQECDVNSLNGNQFIVRNATPAP